jgi:hypothetical protein
MWKVYFKVIITGMQKRWGGMALNRIGAVEKNK